MSLLSRLLSFLRPGPDATEPPEGEPSIRAVPIPGGGFAITNSREEEARLRVIIARRGEIADRFAAARGKTRDQLTLEEVLKVRALPEWKAAGEDAGSGG